VEDVAVGIAHNLLPRASVDSQGHLVSHAAGRYKEGSLKIQHAGGRRLETIDSRVFTVDIIPYLGRGHGFSHLGGGAVDSVGTKIYKANLRSHISNLKSSGFGFRVSGFGFRVSGFGKNEL
jgi:hypothetical protein